MMKSEHNRHILHNLWKVCYFNNWRMMAAGHDKNKNISKFFVNKKQIITEIRTRLTVSIYL